MNHQLNTFLKQIGLFNHLKLFKDKYFENPVHKNYRERLINFYSQFIGKNDYCFDIGASFGNRTETFLALGAKVLSVEPQLNEFKFLNKKFGSKIILIDKAVGSKNGSAKMYLNNHSALSSLSKEWISKVSSTNRFEDAKWKKELNVEVVTLDWLIENYGKPDFCKIDVEGYELEVIKGLSQPIKIISIEFTIPEFTDRAVECLDRLAGFGKILCNYSSAETLQLGLKEWQTLENFKEIFLALPSKNIIDGDIYVKYPDI
jgi:FkbM family methyltransferase